MTKDPRVALGLRVREIRTQQHLSQEQLALKADVDRTYITSLENGHRNVSIILINKICNGLGVSVRDFFDDVMFSEVKGED